MTFQSVLKEFGFKKRNVLHDDGHKSSYWYIQKKNWYAEIHVCTCYTEVWLVGKGLKESNGYPGGYFYGEPEQLRDELILKSQI